MAVRVRSFPDGTGLVVVSWPLARIPGDLSPALADVARWVCRGATDAEIAAARGTSVHTVNNQLRTIFRRLSVGSRAELVALVERHQGERASGR